MRMIWLGAIYNKINAKHSSHDYYVLYLLYVICWVTQIINKAWDETAPSTYQDGFRHNASIEIGNSPKQPVEAYRATLPRSVKGIGVAVQWSTGVWYALWYALLLERGGREALTPGRWRVRSYSTLQCVAITINVEKCRRASGLGLVMVDTGDEGAAFMIFPERLVKGWRAQISIETTSWIEETGEQDRQGSLWCYSSIHSASTCELRDVGTVVYISWDVK